MRPLLVLPLALLLAVLATPALPQGSGQAYNIEIVVFSGGSTTSADAAGSGSARGLSSSGDDAGGGGSARFIGTLPASSLQLGDVAAKLRSSGAYRVVTHAGWTQTPSAWNSRAGFPLARLGVEAPGLSGNAYLERGQYLHLGFALNYSGANITEIRRVRLGEKTYFDNPGVGIIAVVTAASN